MMNALSFRLSSWYSSGVFILTIVILTSILAVEVESVSPLIAILFSSVITLPVSYNNKNDYNGLLVVLNIKPGAYNLDSYNFNIYNFPI